MIGFLSLDGGHRQSCGAGRKDVGQREVTEIPDTEGVAFVQKRLTETVKVSPRKQQTVEEEEQAKLRPLVEAVQAALGKMEQRAASRRARARKLSLVVYEGDMELDEEVGNQSLIAQHLWASVASASGAGRATMPPPLQSWLGLQPFRWKVKAWSSLTCMRGTGPALRLQR